MVHRAGAAHANPGQLLRAGAGIVQGLANRLKNTLKGGFLALLRLCLALLKAKHLEGVVKDMRTHLGSA